MVRAGLSAGTNAVRVVIALLLSGAELRQAWVARNLFLDGNSFRDSGAAEKLHWVTHAGAGLGYRSGRWGVEYRYVVRSREYHAQPRPHGYGSVALRWHR